MSKHALDRLQVAIRAQGPGAGAVPQIMVSEILDLGFRESAAPLLPPSIVCERIALSLALNCLGPRVVSVPSADLGENAHRMAANLA